MLSVDTFGAMLTLLSFMLALNVLPAGGQWPDQVVEWDPKWFFTDNIVPIILELDADPSSTNSSVNLVVLASGVLINEYRLVTTFNPFRELVKDNNMLKKVKVVTVRGRKKIAPGKFEYIYTAPATFSCGRQVTYTPDKTIPSRLWHGNEKDPTAQIHCPYHDVMVLRFSKKLNKAHYMNTETYDFNNFETKKIGHTYTPGPFKAVIASYSSTLTGWIKIAAFELTPDEMLTYETVKNYNKLLRSFRRMKVWSYNIDKLRVNCNDYFPQSWGHFICVNNTDNIESLSSGAILMQGGRVYGLGAFVVHREESSVLVFTDLRLYYTLIWNTCTDYDMDTIRWTVNRIEKATNNDEKQVDAIFRDENLFRRKIGYSWHQVFDKNMS